jgi:hypothetical protein
MHGEKGKSPVLVWQSVRLFQLIVVYGYVDLLEGGDISADGLLGTGTGLRQLFAPQACSCPSGDSEVKNGEQTKSL